MTIFSWLDMLCFVVNFYYEYAT